MKNVKQVNQYLANLAVWNIKLHALHFNVVGKQFVPVHEFLETIYDNAFEYYDAVAEHLKMMKEKPMVSISEYLEAASLKEVEGDVFSCEDALKYVLEDMKLMKAEAEAIRAEADEEGNFLLVGMMEDHVEYYVKQIWFIESTLA